MKALLALVALMLCVAGCAHREAQTFPQYDCDGPLLAWMEQFRDRELEKSLNAP